MDNLLERREHISEALRRLPPYATALGEVVGSGPGLPDQPVRPTAREPRRGAAGHLLPAGQAAGQPRRLPARVHRRAPDHQAEVTMTQANRPSTKPLAADGTRRVAGGDADRRWSTWCGRRAPGHKVVGYFSSAVGLYPGDDVRVVGVPVGTIDSIEPGPRRQDHHDGEGRRQAARRRPRARSSRRTSWRPASFNSPRPTQQGPVLADGARSGWTAPPCRWNGTTSRSS